jgi:hypothetical protein
MVCLNTNRIIYFQQDSARGHTSNDSLLSEVLCCFVGQCFRWQKISRGLWPYSPDLTPTDFYLWDMATTCNRNEKQQDVKNISEIQTEWTKTTWKTFEETIRGLGVTRDG